MVSPQGIDREHAILLCRAKMYMEDPRPLPALWLGAQEAAWCWNGRAHARVMVSAKRLRRVRTLRLATVPVFVDSGAFSEIAAHGRWTTSVHDYAAYIIHVDAALGGIEHAGVQDWMCEAEMLERTGLTVEEHQRRSVASYLELRALAPAIPWVPTLQGHTLGEYLRCVQMFRDAGVHLGDVPLVGLGSVCRRDDPQEIADVVTGVRAELGARTRLHGYGVKSEAAVRACWDFASMDSMAWSDRGRHRESDLRRALGLSVNASPTLVFAAPDDRLDLDLLDFLDWKRETGVNWAQNSLEWAEFWRARQIEALAVELVDRLLASGQLLEGPGQLGLAMAS